ncbi:agl cluster protein AglQ [bacterium]|nr:MAG: agl cluster protein AglQ [bacterium]
MTLYDILVESASAGIALLRDDGSMPPGHNGPYNDPETPIRNTAHWLITFAKAFEITSDVRFFDAVTGCAKYLISDETRPGGAAFFCRNNPEKDFSNGLIGQAWVFEALASATDLLDDNIYIEFAKEVYRLHKFEQDFGLWHILNVDGSFGPIDMTFNHQLWFAACAGLLLKPLDGIGAQVRRFLDCLDNNFRIYKKGRIAHSIPKTAVSPGIVGALKSIKGRLTSSQEDRIFEKDREIGYHAFNLYAFGMLAERFPEHDFWQSRKMKTIADYIEREEFINGIKTSRFGYPYNPPGFECAYAITAFPQYFDNPDSLIANWVSRQIEKCFDNDSSLMVLNSADSMTSAARIYEATRLPDISIE